MDGFKDTILFFFLIYYHINNKQYHPNKIKNNSNETLEGCVQQFFF